MVNCKIFALIFVSEEEVRNARQVAKVSSLHIALQEGFDDDEVIVTLNGASVFHKRGVSTRLQTGYADACEVESAEGDIEISVSLPSRKLSKSIRLPASKRFYIGVSVTPDGQLIHRIASQPFGYV
ncbi:MAG TPA: hypothetical protein VNN09_15945 [Candidatus Competibacteraceae bacterium]|nr:hypothetical protein [Candidatus Competibacteraceae bacterium]